MPATKSTVYQPTPQILSAGGLGGMAPNLLNLAARFRAEGLLPLSAIIGESISLIIVGGIGAVIVYFNKETVPMKAFLLGVACPALILNTAGAADEPPPTPAQTAVQSSTAASFAAMGVTVRAAVQRQPGEMRRLTINVKNADLIKPRIVVDIPNSIDEEMHIDERAGWNISTMALFLTIRGDLKMPDGQVVPVETARTPIPAGSAPIVIELSVEQTVLGGVLDGFGFDNLARRFMETQAEITEVRTPKH